MQIKALITLKIGQGLFARTWNGKSLKRAANFMHASQLLIRLLSKFITKPKKFSASADDIHLISYPRSGSTWLRVIISETVYGESGNSIKDLLYYVPDLHVWTPANKVIKSEHHIVKSHHTYCNSTVRYPKRVIYLIRDPRDIVISYYRYLKKLESYCFEFDKFFEDWISGRIWPGSWQEHVSSWVGPTKSSMSFDLHLIRYEDLVADTETQIFKLSQFLGLNVTQELVEEVVAKATVENLLEKERRGIQNNDGAIGMNFIGPATSGQWKEKLTPDQLELIGKYAGHMMQFYGY